MEREILAAPEESPFGEPVFWRDTVSSTMDEARALAAEGAAHGTAVCAGFQERGRGRAGGRSWQGERGKHLAFTVILHFSRNAGTAGGAGRIPEALTLRTGLAVSHAVEDFAPVLQGRVRIKWPNDIMLLLPGGRAAKSAGILVESDGSRAHVGIGVNLGQTEFPPELQNRATSLVLAARAWGADGGIDGAEAAADPGGAPKGSGLARLLLLILARLRDEFGAAGEAGAPAASWKERLPARLYMRGERVRFLAGSTEKNGAVTGILAGIGDGGEILIRPEGGGGTIPFVTGELDVY